MSSDQEIREAKKSIRKRIRAIRESSVAFDSSSIVSGLQTLPEWKAASTVLLYHPLPGEVDLRPLLGVPGKRIVLPLVSGEDLLLKEYAPGSLVRGFAGIEEPAASAPDVDPSEIGLAVIPGVAFDSACRRLGRGRGFYDRLLPKLGCPLAGVAFSWQMVEAVPSDPWDVPLDILVTPERIFRKQQ